jgi:transposase-like protein
VSPDHGHRSRALLGTFGKMRARLNIADGKTGEWKSRMLRAYQRRTLAADALIAGCYLAGTNTRRVRPALGALFGGAVCKDTVSIRIARMKVRFLFCCNLRQERNWPRPSSAGTIDQ